MKSLIVGSGSVGRELHSQLNKEGFTSSFFTSKHPRDEYRQYVEWAEVVFLAIPTRDEGHIALKYTLEATEMGIPVVTCEKGALAYHFQSLSPHLSRIGYTATVGGGSGMLDLLKFSHFGFKKIHAIINGTLNFLLSGGSLSEALRLGLCEPGSTGLSAVVHSELRDVMLKLIIVYYLSRVSEQSLTPADFSFTTYSEAELQKMMDKRDFRYVITISQEKHPRPVFGMWAKRGDWVIKGEFLKTEVLPFDPPARENNLLYLQDNFDLAKTVIGPGAGPKPTAATMIGDARQLRRSL